MITELFQTLWQHRKPEPGLHWWCSAFSVLFGMSIWLARSGAAGVTAQWESYDFIPTEILGLSFIAAGILNLWAWNFRLQLVCVMSIVPYLYAAFDFWYTTGSSQAAIAYVFLFVFQMIIIDVGRRNGR